MKPGWKVRRLGEVATFQRGLTYSKTDEVDHSNVVVLRANNIDLTTGLLDLAELRYLRNDFPVPDKVLAKAGAILLCTASGSRSHLGKAALIEQDTGFAFGGFMGALTPASNLDPSYLFYWMRSDAYHAGLGSLSGGTNINNLRGSQLLDFELPILPLAEQRRIVEVLDEAFAALATATANTEQTLANSREVFESSRAAIFAQAAKWQLVELGDCVEVLDRLRKPITKRDRTAGEYPYYGASGVLDHVAGYIFEEPLVLLGEDGAKWESGERSAFKIEGKTWVNNHAHVVRPNRSRVLDDWLVHFLNHSNLMPYVTGLTVPKLNQAMMRSIPIPLPPIAEQRRFVSNLSDFADAVEQLQQAYTDKLILVAELRQSLLARAFAGELTQSTNLPQCSVANDNFSGAEFAANVIAFAFEQHEAAGTQATFGRVKAQKFLQLVETDGRIDLGREPIKDAAGPNDFQHMLRAQNWAEQCEFFTFKERTDGSGFLFTKLNRYEEMSEAASAATAGVNAELMRAVRPIISKNSRQTELLVTVQAAWNNVILNGEEPTDESIIHEARENWTPSKRAIPRAEFVEALREVRRLGIEPDGTAKRVTGQEHLL